MEVTISYARTIEAGAGEQYHLTGYKLSHHGEDGLEFIWHAQVTETLFGDKARQSKASLFIRHHCLRFTWLCFSRINENAESN